MKTLQGTLVLSAAVAALAFTAAPLAIAQPAASNAQPADGATADHSQHKATKDKKSKARTGAQSDTSTDAGDENTSSASPNTVNPARDMPTPPAAAGRTREPAVPPTGVGSMDSTRGGVTDADPPK